MGDCYVPDVHFKSWCKVNRNSTCLTAVTWISVGFLTCDEYIDDGAGIGDNILIIDGTNL